MTGHFTVMLRNILPESDTYDLNLLVHFPISKWINLKLISFY